MESFWGALKNELVYHGRFYTWVQAIQEITEHIEYFYTRQQKKARLGYLSLLPCSDIMQINSLLNPLGYAIANRPHYYLYTRINAR